VENISIETTYKQIGEFFSFCGTITALSVIPDSHTDTKVRAIITFESAAMASVSLLLNAAVLNNSIINVKELSMDDQSNQSNNVIDPEPEFETDQLPHYVSDDGKERTQTSVVVSLLAKGYSLSADAFQRAKEFDQSQLTKQLDQQMNNIMSRVDNLDRYYQVTEKTKQLQKSISDGYKQLDNNYNITGNMQRAGDSVYGILFGAAQVVSTSINYASGSVGQYVETHPEVKKRLDDAKAASFRTYQQISDMISPAPAKQ